MNQLKIGDKAPDFTAWMTNGKAEAEFIASNQKKGVVLFFYPKDMTSGCTVEAEEFSSLYNRFKEVGFEVYGISKDSLASHKNFITKKSLKTPLISDEDHKIAEAYGVWVEKNMYGKKYMGMNRDTFIISKDGIIMNIMRKVKAKGHASSVLSNII